MILALLLLAQAAVPAPIDPRLAARVDRVLAAQPVIDGHNDLAWELREAQEGRVEATDLTRDTAALPRLFFVEGGLRIVGDPLAALRASRVDPLVALRSE